MHQQLHLERPQRQAAPALAVQSPQRQHNDHGLQECPPGIPEPVTFWARAGRYDEAPQGPPQGCIEAVPER
eukprot:7776274-Pyramimonas_sp.AAC.1